MNARQKAERLFLKANPTAVVLKWTMPMRRTKFPSGVKGMGGRFLAHAPGHVCREVLVTVTPDGMMVR